MARRSVRLDQLTLERLRVARGYARQSDLAEAAGLSAATVSRVESGATGSMAEETALQLARVLGVELAALLAPPTGDPVPVDDAERIAERIAERVVHQLVAHLPAVLRAVLAEANGAVPAEANGRDGQRGQPAGRLAIDPWRNTDKNDEACPGCRLGWPANRPALASAT